MKEFIAVAGCYEWHINDENENTVLTIDGESIGEQVAECATEGELHDLCESIIDAANAELEEMEKNEETLDDGSDPVPLDVEECNLATEALFEAWKEHYSIHAMSIDDFMHYLNEQFSIEAGARSIIRNTLDYFYAHYCDMGFDVPEMCNALEELFSGTGITASELRRIDWEGEA